MSNTHHILVTGNGFDLYHGLKTNYQDFLTAAGQIEEKPEDQRTKWEQKIFTLCIQNGFFRYFQKGMAIENDWNGFEAELEKIVTVFIDFFKKLEEQKKEPQFDISRYSIFCESFSYYELRVFQQFFRLFEQIYDDLSGGLFKIRQDYITDGRELNQKGMIQELCRELDNFTRSLGLYLSHCAEPKSCTARWEKLLELQPDYVINFNYTDTCRLYDIPREQIFYAKGRADSQPLNMILGIPDDSQDNLDFIYFKNYFQNIIRFTGIPDKQQLYPTDSQGLPVPVITHIFGYSMPTGDEMIIRQLETASRQMIIYYTDQEDYAKKVISLIRLFGKEAALEKIQTGKFTLTAL